MSQPEWDRAQWRPRREPLHLAAPDVGGSWDRYLWPLTAIATLVLGILIGLVL